MIYVLYAILPALLVGSGLAELLRRKAPVVKDGRKSLETRPSPKTPKNRPIPQPGVITQFTEATMTTYAALLAIAAGAIVAYFCHNYLLKMEMAANYYSCNGMWREVLDVASKRPQSKFINHAANHALYRSGLLTQEMFRYGQHPAALMLTSETTNPMGWWRLFDTYLDLGHANLAEYSLVMLLDMYGERPLIMKRLVLVSMVKGDIGTAKIYLGALSKTLFDAAWARSYLEKIERDPNLTTDKEVQDLRSKTPRIDRDFKDLDESIFFDLLARNKHNRMAFEYLMAFYLLTNQFDKFMVNIERLDDFDYKGIPRVYEEAILLYSNLTKKQVEVPGRTI